MATGIFRVSNIRNNDKPVSWAFVEAVDLKPHPLSFTRECGFARCRRCREQPSGRWPSWLPSADGSEGECVFYGFGKDDNWVCVVCIGGGNLAASSHQSHSLCSLDRSRGFGISKHTHTECPQSPSIWRSNAKAEPWMSLSNTIKKERGHSVLLLLSLLPLFFRFLAFLSFCLSVSLPTFRWMGLCVQT